MNREQHGHEETVPVSTRVRAKQSEQQDGSGTVQQQIRGVVASRPEAVQFEVQKVGKPGEWMPVGKVERLECPSDRLPAESLLENRIFVYVRRVVVIDEVEENCSAVEENDDGQQADVRENPTPRGWGD